MADRHAEQAALAVALAYQTGDDQSAAPLRMAGHAAVGAAIEWALDRMRTAGQLEGRVHVATDIAAFARQRAQTCNTHGADLVDEFTQGLWAAWHVALGEEVARP